MEYVNPQIEEQLLTNVDALKYKAILRYFKFIGLLKKGYKSDYQTILEIISLIDIYSDLDGNRNFYKEFYLNDLSTAK